MSFLCIQYTRAIRVYTKTIEDTGGLFPGGRVGGGGVLPYISYIGMCGPIGYGFQGNHESV